MHDNNKRCLQECLLKQILLQPSLVTNLKLIVIIHFPMQFFNKSTIIARGNPVIIIKQKINIQMGAKVSNKLWFLG